MAHELHAAHTLHQYNPHKLPVKITFM